MKTNRVRTIAVLTLAVGCSVGVQAALAQAQSQSPAQRDAYYLPGQQRTFRPSAPAPAAQPAPAARPAPAQAPAPAPAPAPAARPAPAPAPAPAAQPAAGQGRSFRPPVGADQVSSRLAFPTGDINTGALMIDRVTPRQVRVGQQFTEDIYVTNITTGDLQNVMVTLSGFQNFAVASSNPQAMTGTGPGTLSWNLGTLRAGETKLIKLTGTSSAVGNTSSCVSASFANTLCFGTTVVSPELRVTKTMTPQATVCDTIQAVITVTNSGTGSATNVKVVDQLPAGLTTTDGRNSIEQTIASLGGGESREIRLNLKAAKSGRYENNAQASADGIQTVNSGNVATVVTAPSVAVTCTAPQQIFIGRDARFDFAVRSTGDAPCDTVVTIPVPAGAQFVSATEGGTLQGNAVTWNLGSMAPNATRNISMVVRPAGLGTISIAGNGNCRNCPAPVTFNCSTSVTGIPALLLDGVDDPDPVQVGENVVYTLRVTNQGSAPLTNVTLVGQFEANTMQFVSATPAPSGVQGTTINFPPIATLAPGATSTYRITIKALEAGQVQFRAEAKSNEITRPLLKVETTNFYR